MISNIDSIIVRTAKMTDRSAASTCSLGLSGSAFIGSGLSATGLSGVEAARLALSATALPVVERRNERPTKALEAAVAGKAKHLAYGFAATGAGTQQQTMTHHTMWAFRGLEPWSDPA
ncbi:hypothetical protein ACGFMM_04605 [Streptomyces sp. NPDC048604]|uniref:hypothetical protein n=1 Tax=Streptomyces sp. NPDC048604 TaxID=3365578 RepID=UPI0037214ED3